jgi:hypothetical protein
MSFREIRHMQISSQLNECSGNVVSRDNNTRNLNVPQQLRQSET